MAKRLCRIAAIFLLALATTVQAGVNASISGTVTDAVTGSGIENVTVILYFDSGGGVLQQQGMPETTGVNGDYGFGVFIDSAPEDFWIEFDPSTVSGNTYVNEVFDSARCPQGDTTCILTRGDRIPVASGANEIADADLDEGGLITGKLQQFGGKADVAGGTVRIYDANTGTEVASAVSDVNGTYTAHVPSSAFNLAPAKGFAGEFHVVADVASIGLISEIYDGESSLFCPNGDLRCQDFSTRSDLGGAVFLFEGDSRSIFFDFLEDGADVSGTVVSAASGNPISGVQVCLFEETFGGQAGKGLSTFEETGACGTTNANGDYTTFPPVFPSMGEVFYRAVASGAEVQPEVFDNVPCNDGECDLLAGDAVSAPSTGIDFALSQRTYPFSGTITDSATGAGIAGATVTLTRSGSGATFNTTTDANGDYMFQLTKGGYAVTASAPEFQSGQYVNGLFVDVSATFPGQENIDIALDPILYPISGNISNASTGQGVEGAVVEAFNQDGTSTGVTTTTDANGDFTLMIRAGTYEIRANAAGFVEGVFAGKVLITVNASNPGFSGLTIALEPEVFSISGTVSDADNGALISGAEVCVSQGGMQIECVLSDSNGMYATSLLTAGQTYDLAVTASGFEPADASIMLTDAVVQDFALDPLLFTVSGRVTDFLQGGALAGADVCLTPAGGGDPICTITDGSGNYTTPGVRTGVYTLSASFPEFTSQSRQRALTDMDLVGEDFVLLPIGAGLSGTVTLDDAFSGKGGFRLGNVRIAVYSDSGALVTTTKTDNNGSYAFPIIPEGTFFILADGSARGFFSEIYAGAGVPGIECVIKNCPNRIMEGAPVAVAEGLDASGIDFELAAGRTISEDNLDELDELGAAVAICGDRIAIGAPGDDDAGIDAGAVYVYRREGSGYVLEQKLLPMVDETTGTPVDGERFGSALGCSGDLIVIGAPGDDQVVAKGTGPDKSAYVMQLGGMGGGDVNKLIAGNLGFDGDDGFGTAVAMDGNMIAIGAPNAADATSGQDSGAVSMVEVSDGGEPQSATVVSDPNANAGAGFGTSVSVSGNKMAVGAPGMINSSAAQSGAAQIFQNLAGAGLTNVGTVQGQQAGENFGASVSLDGDMMAVGSPGNDTAGTDAGAAFVYMTEGDNLVQVGGAITANDPTSEASFGSSVSLSGNQMAIGAPGANGLKDKTGAGYLFGLVGGAFGQVGKNLSEIGEGGDQFGLAVAYDGENFVVGAPSGRPEGIPTGFAAAFTNPDRLFKVSFERR